MQKNTMALSQDSSYRLVHLDLKGAPPKISYFEQIFPLLQQFGANGLLVEYEDMFPYYGELSVLASADAYSMADIEQLQNLATQNGMDVIPLVQTFGHLEFVLKHEKFVHIREVSNYPMALCPSHSESLSIVTRMIDQVMKVHPASSWFHVGSDEVYHLGICDSCKKRMAMENLSREKLFFSHVYSVLNHVRVKYPKVTPIMWDDMFRHCDVDTLKASGLGDIVEPMIWTYSKDFLPQEMWQNYGSVFPNIWLASAFKGATGSSVYATDITCHIDNHLMWLSSVENERAKFQSVRGIAITGWSRYDHYAVMCELLPEAIPSLAICLEMITTGTFTHDVHIKVSDQLGLSLPLPLNPFHSLDVPQCTFPGGEIYSNMVFLIQLTAQYENFVHNDRLHTWMNMYHTQKNFTNTVHIESIIPVALILLGTLKDMREKLQSCLSKVFFARAVDEWLSVYLQPKLDRLQEIVSIAQAQLLNNSVVK